MAILLLCTLLSFSAAAYSVVAVRDSLLPLLSSNQNQSSFKFNYNAAACQRQLLVRCQNSDAAKGPYAVTPSVLALTSVSGGSIDNSTIVFSSIDDPLANYGTEDPRLTFDGKDYVLTYTAAHAFKNGSVVAKLSWAKSPTLAAGSWNVLGEMLPKISYSKSGAIIPGSKPLTMIFGDSSLVPGLQIAVFDDSEWIIRKGVFLPTRPNSWDSHLVESGPPALELSDGNFLFFYNSARTGFPSQKPGFNLQYNIGFVILNGTDYGILQRSDEPILSPKLAWETGRFPQLDLTPNVVFANGAEALEEKDSFRLFYGGADSVIGSATVKITSSI